MAYTYTLTLDTSEIGNCQELQKFSHSVNSDSIILHHKAEGNLDLSQNDACTNFLFYPTNVSNKNINDILHEYNGSLY